MLCGSAMAGMGVGAAGISYDRVAGNPGFHIMYGSQFILDHDASNFPTWPGFMKLIKPQRIEGRFLYTKYNYGKIEIDQLGFEQMYYYDFLRKYWDLQFALHTAGTYEKADGHIGFITGGELRKDFSDKFGLFIAGDILFTDKSPFDVFFLTLGLMIKLQ